MNFDHESCYRAVCARDVRFDGRFFTGVRTTGVYCRPVCPARTPKAQNVEFFPTAAAAHEAGFRPCLRCRPETAPGSGAWQGTSSTVSRALTLMEHGGLDDFDLPGLAGRLGVGDRQLRRLFKQQVGAPPIAVVQTRRLLLAKQLIHETQLPMTEVAFAAGFRSIRRFNEAFVAALGCSPSALRRSRKPDMAVGTAGPIRLSLRYRPPYDWQAMLEFLRRRAIRGVEAVVASRYERTLELDGAVGMISVEPGRNDSLCLSVRTSKLGALPTIIARVRRVFDLDADPQCIAEHFAGCPILSQLVRDRPGLRVPGAWDGFELAVRAVLGQQITVTAAVKLAEKMVAIHGRPLAEPMGALTHLFPSPEALADADLTRLGMPGARATTLSDVAKAAIADQDFFEVTSQLDVAVRRFRTVRGIGEWTAQYIALRQLHEPDAFPAADIGLLRAMAQHSGQEVSAAELLERSKQWQPWRAYAAQHLWSSA